MFDSHPGQNADIFKISADGGKPVRLTTETARDAVPNWSRDGKWIYFRSDRSGTWQIWKVLPDGGSAIPVTEHGGFECEESADGAYLYYARMATPASGDCR